MKRKKLVPIVLALTAVTTVAAGAASATAPTVTQPNSAVVSQAEQQLLHKLCEKYGFTICEPQVNCPIVKPDCKPSEAPDPKPDETPDANPDETPEPKPDETPDETPDNKPDETPDGKPDETPDVPPAPTPDETPDNKPDADAPLPGYAAEVVRLVNAERAKNGLGALKVDSRVQQAAQVRAKEQAQLFSHTRPNGSSCFTALAEAGVSYRGAGENIAYGQPNPSVVMNAWMNSEGHRANILNANFTTIGVGYTVINGTAYWAQMFTY